MFAQSIFVSLLAAASVVAAPTTFSKRATPACSTSTPDFVADLTCPSIQLLSGFLSFQGDSIGQQAINILSEANSLLLSNNPAGEIIKDVTTGITEGIVDSVVFSLKDLAATIPELEPACACNMVLCNSELQDAVSECNLGSPNAPEACGQAIFACSQFYTRQEINKVAPCCSTFQFGQTSS